MLLSKLHFFEFGNSSYLMSDHAEKKREQGFSLVEVLVAITLLMIMIVPAMNALTEGVLASRIHGDQADAARKLQNKMEEILARSFTKLDVEALGANSSATTPLTFPTANPATEMDDSGYSDASYDVSIFRCSKNAANNMVPDNASSTLLCIQIKPKGSSVILLQSLKAG